MKQRKIIPELILLAVICVLVQSGKKQFDVWLTDGGAVEEKSGKKIAITFDDGPSKAYTPKLLDGLKKRNVHASFFVIGKQAEKNPEIIERMYKEGHVIGNHTYHHLELTKLNKEKERKEIEKTNKVIEKITGNPPAFIRPPFGAWREENLKEVELIPVLWDVDPLDWCIRSTEEIVRRVVTKAEENDIILLHDCYETSVEAALEIIDDLQKEGYEFVTVDELVME
nr:polysaccharide deacetylase family protein [uncultured Sellimonas sp.]